jgi:hypothetical protein
VKSVPRDLDYVRLIKGLFADENRHVEFGVVPLDVEHDLERLGRPLLRGRGRKADQANAGFICGRLPGVSRHHLLSVGARTPNGERAGPVLTRVAHGLPTEAAETLRGIPVAFVLVIVAGPVWRSESAGKHIGRDFGKLAGLGQTLSPVQNLPTLVQLQLSEPIQV